MAEATNQQLQAYADQRIRPRAESVRSLINAVADDKNSIDDVYARAAGSNAWADARTDGPPHLLQAGNEASPDDILNYNAFATRMLWLFNNIGSPPDPDLTTFAANVRSELAVLERACVRPVSQ